MLLLAARDLGGRGKGGLEKGREKEQAIMMMYLCFWSEMQLGRLKDRVVWAQM